jgi:hypothetical protein
VDLGGYGKIFEVGKIPPSLEPPHAPKFFFRFGARWKIVRINRLAIHLLGEVQKHLRQIGGGLQTIGARTIVPLAISIQLQLKPQIFNVKIVGTLFLLVALVHQHAQHCLQRLAVIGQRDQIGIAVHLHIGRKSSVISYLKL